MALSDVQVARLDDIFGAVEGNSDRLRQSDLEFLESVRERYQKFQHNIFLTSRQWDWLEDILTKCR